MGIFLEARMNYSSYRKLVSILKKKCPPAYPVTVRRTKITSKLDGDCSLHKKQFYIRISRDLNESSAIDTLLHEWAHAIAWNHLHDSMDWSQFEERVHDASWGVAYSEVYRVYEQYFLKEASDRCGKFRYK